MKKAIMLFCMAMSLFATNAFAQLEEVRGVETRRVVYDGPRYKTGGSSTEYSTKYYGWEFHNRNSIAVSVDIELWRERSNNEKIKVTTKTIVLDPNETYVFKQEDNRDFRKDDCWNEIYKCYIEYKACKLQ